MRESHDQKTGAEAYRPDVDGLRAIAVLSVIMYHVDQALVPGGFVGVDIFFVISGYLISLGILRGLKNGSFSLLDFYRRRVKRIAPAMLVVVAVVLLASQFLLRPDDAEKAARSAFWSVLSLTNVYFWRSSDTSYFAPSSSELPFLHLWSLGVEEQFYLLWPLTLLLLRRWLWSRWTLPVVLVIIGASFLAAEMLSKIQPDFSYYMLPTRAGELLIGALVAFRDLKRQSTSPTPPAPWRTPVAGLGLALICGSLAFIHEGDLFPGWRAVPPTLGAALLILAGGEGMNPFSRLLAVRPMVWVGLVSYSAYLWHWPILAMYRYGHATLPHVIGFSLLPVIFLLAWLSYRYVETPGRRSKSGAWATIIRQYMAPAGVLACLAFAFVKSHGFALHRFVPQYEARLTQIQEQTKPAFEYDYVCQRQLLTPTDLADPKCVLGPKGSQAVNALLWGDSHAAHYVGVIGAIAEAGGFRVRNVAIGSCPPLLGDPEPFVTTRRLEECRASLDLLQKTSLGFPVIILAAKWTYYQDQSPEFIKHVSDTVQRLVGQGKKVILLGQIPFIAGLDKLCEEKALSYPGMECKPFVVDESQSIPKINLSLQEMARGTPAVQYFDVARYLCSAGTCSAFDSNGIRRYYDKSHLLQEGSWFVGRMVVANEGVPPAFKAAFARN